MKAYHNDPAVKSAILAQLVAHRKADEIVQGQYWEGGKGCAVGCTLHTSNHAEYETRFGIPQMLAHLEDGIFEGLPNGVANAWPERFMGAIEPGADLSRVGWQFMHWLITDESINPGISDPLVRAAVKQCADVLVPLMKGGAVDEYAASAASAASAAWSAASAARRAASAKSAAWSAAWSAESAASAAWSAGSAARSAESTAWSAARRAESAASAARSAAWSAAWSAESAARSAESTAWSAAWSAESAESASAESAARSAESAAYIRMADKLIELICQQQPER